MTLEKIVDNVKASLEFRKITIESDEKLWLENTKSKWIDHVHGDYQENEFYIDLEGLDYILNQDAVAFILENQETIYNVSIEFFIENKFNNDDTGFWLEDYLDGEVPTIDLQWLKRNVKLVGYKILSHSKTSIYLEIDYACSWEDEHGVVTLWNDDKIVDIGEGGTCF